jgi:hypothetical protein
MKLKVSNPMFYNHPNCFLKIVSWSNILLNYEASLGKALSRVKGLEAKLTSNTKALEEAQTRLAAIEVKRKEEIAAAKHAATQVIREVEVRASKAEDALAKISQEQSRREEMAIARLNSLSTTFGSTCLLSLRFCSSI